MNNVKVFRRGIIGVTLLVAASASADNAIPIVALDQGPEWTHHRRDRFYSQDQGSRIMPLAWMRALKLPNGAGFLDDGLERYGYLHNPQGIEPDVPVGFTVAEFQGELSIGMTCSACHTRQVYVNDTAYRIDGGPAMVDFQVFLKDLDEAVGAVLEASDTFDSFAESVLGASLDATNKAELTLALETWYTRFHALIERSLPDPAWGPGRLDAVSMIFNRLTGLDIGEPPTYLIEENIAIADAPTRYPFLWNAARQDKTQWPGFADNGNDILGLARNLGEVYGVFGWFHPLKQDGLFQLNRNYIKQNSANFEGLGIVEDLIWKIGSPKWPWQLDETLVSKGQKIFNLPPAEGGCKECHQKKAGAIRSILHRTWATPIMDVGTDRRECEILTRQVETGVLSGAKVPFLGDAIGETDTAFNVLRTAVLGAIVQNTLSFGTAGEEAVGTEVGEPSNVPPEFEYLPGAFQIAETAEIDAEAELDQINEPSGCAYEARVLEGIWATAPYLHNGSVPTLRALLMPVERTSSTPEEEKEIRPSSFKLGPDYDIENVGLAKEQTKFDYTLDTTDCSDVGSGNSRCGHNYGTTMLSDEERDALLEYLKSL